jgi:hypothetical protein
LLLILLFTLPLASPVSEAAQTQCLQFRETRMFSQISFRNLRLLTAAYRGSHASNAAALIDPRQVRTACTRIRITGCRRSRFRAKKPVPSLVRAGAGGVHRRQPAMCS